MNEAETMKWLKDRVDIESTILRYATGADRRDWALMRSIFADEVHVDFSSFGGGPAATVTGDGYIDLVKALIPGFDATQHQLTNFVIDVDGDSADCVAYMQAEHFVRDGDEQLSQAVGGYYTYRLSRVGADWKINRLKLTVTWSRGEMRAYAIATKRAAAMAEAPTG